MDGESYWQRNLVIVMLSQFVTYMGVSMAIPFTPFYIRECLGITAPGKLKLFVGLASTMPVISLSVMGPIWGLLADKYGRKLMMLRANIAGAIFIALMGYSPQLGSFFASIGMPWCKPIYIFLFLRLMQGTFTGTSSAAMTLVSTCTPRERQGYALAMISAAFFTGEIAGSVVGGYLAAAIGYQNSFYVGGSLWFVAAIIIALGATEHFTRPVRVPRAAQAPRVPFMQTRFAQVMLPAIPLFALYVISNFARNVDASQFPLVVESLNGGPSMPYAARWTSVILAVGCLGAMLSAFVLGHFIDRHPTLTSSICSICSGAFMALVPALPFLFQGLSRVHLSLPGIPDDGSASVVALLGVRFITIFFMAGLEPICNSWLAKVTPQDSKGLMFGAAITFRSTGQILAHTVGAWLSMYWGFTAIYVFGPILFIILFFMFIWTGRRLGTTAPTPAPKTTPKTA